jgi:hypothetical protein
MVRRVDRRNVHRVGFEGVRGNCQNGSLDVRAVVAIIRTPHWMFEPYGNPPERLVGFQSVYDIDPSRHSSDPSATTE